MKEELKIGILVAAFFLVVIGGAALFLNSGVLAPGYPIESKVYTTLERTVVPVPVPLTAPAIYPYQVDNYSENGYGIWRYGRGLAREKRTDLMPPGYTNTTATNTAELLHYFTMADVHITDKESPAQAIFDGYRGGNIAAYSPVMLTTTQVLDAAIQTVNALHKEKPFDFGIILDDAINQNQYNELRWYIDVFDGKKIKPWSGMKGDPVPGPLNDYQDEYKAAGIAKTLTWYEVIGNHDQYWMGADVPNDYLKKTLVGGDILNAGSSLADPDFLNERGFFMGSMNGTTPYGDVYGAGPSENFTSPPKVIAADPNRHSLSQSAWMSEFYNSTTNPRGHGFSRENVKTGFASYSFEPKAGIPIKIISLDDTMKDTLPNISTPYALGSLDQERYDWLVQELESGQAEGKLMIIASHVPIRDEPLNATGALWTTTSPVSEQQLIAKLHTYPNFVVWMAGHLHKNTVTAFKSPDESRPELGFWEVETSSLRDFPQQFRMFTIVRNTDNTVSVITTNVDPAFREGSFIMQSRSYAIASHQLFNNYVDLLPTGSYNAELVKPLSPEMQVKIQNYGTSPKL
ncbi:MAG: TIGR03768 family metallophosphoesterase [Methanoregula sp.]|nr:TIGR03768 family metallophosphoesterase [Methanoregula sp.]